MTTRLEFGRFDDYIPRRTNTVREYDVNRWFEWADNFKRIARYNRVPVLANNMYDAKYIEYLTGVEALVLPSWCGKGEISTILRNKMKPKRSTSHHTEVTLILILEILNIEGGRQVKRSVANTAS